MADEGRKKSTGGIGAFLLDAIYQESGVALFFTKSVN